MDNEKESDIRVPLALSVFCFSVISGGIFLVFYVFVPNLSQPWYPIVALILIGSPWLFWLLTYLYTCIKACCLRGPSVDHQISRRQTTTRNTSSREPEMPFAHAV